MAEERKTWTRSIYVNHEGTTYRAKLNCSRPADSYRTGDIEAEPVGRWTYVDDAGSTGGIGHYSSQGNRERWARKTRSGLVLVLTFGTGYYGNDEGGSSWGWDGFLTVTTLGSDAAIDAALENVVDAESA